MASKKSSAAELVSLMFVLGRFVREEGTKRPASGDHCSLLQFETLRFVRDHGEPLMRDVAMHFNVTPPAATLLVDGLVKERFIARVMDRKDRRAIRLVLTASGRSLLAKGLRAKMKRLERIFDTLSVKEKAQLLAMFKKMVKNTVK